MTSARSQWLHAFKKKYEARYPNWRPLDGPRDFEHHILIKKTQPSGYDRPTTLQHAEEELCRSTPAHILEKHGFYLLVNHSIITVSRLQSLAAFAGFEVRSLNRVQIAAARDEDSIHVDVANIHGIDEETLLERVGELFAPSNPDTVFDLADQNFFCSLLGERVARYSPTHGISGYSWRGY